MAKLNICTVSTMLIKDASVLKNWGFLAECLGIPEVELVSTVDRSKAGTIPKYELISQLLRVWESRNGSKHADLPALVSLLNAQVEFRDAARQLAAKFPGEVGPLEVTEAEGGSASDSCSGSDSGYEQSSISLQDRYRKCGEGALGKGAFGFVYKVADLQNRNEKTRYYALKEISFATYIYNTIVPKCPSEYRKRLFREVDTMRRLKNHENIVQLHGCWFWEMSGGGNDQNHGGFKKYTIGLSTQQQSVLETEIYEDTGSGNKLKGIGVRDNNTFFSILMELCDKSLQSWMTDRGQRQGQSGKSESWMWIDIANDILLQALRGLDAMHKLNITHRDLYPANILVNALNMELEECRSRRVGMGASGLLVKITDFGLSRDLSTQTTLTVAAGKDSFQSPEMQAKEEKYSTKTDIYSLGLVYLLLLDPISDENVRKSHFAEIRGDYGGAMREGRLRTIEESVGTELKMLRDMLEINVALRPTAEALISRLELREQVELKVNYDKNLVSKFLNFWK